MKAWANGLSALLVVLMTCPSAVNASRRAHYHHAWRSSSRMFVFFQRIPTHTVDHHQGVLQQNVVTVIMFIENTEVQKSVSTVLQPYPTVLNDILLVLNTIVFSLFPPITPCPCPLPVSLCKLVQHLTSRCERHEFSPNHHRQPKYESKGAKQDEPAETLLSLCISVAFCGFSAPWCPCGPCCRPGEEGAECPCGLGGGGG